MRIYYCLAAVSALLLLVLLNPIPATLAATPTPTPTPTPRTISLPRVTNYAFLPLIIGSGQMFMPKKGVPLTYDFCSDVAAMNATWLYDWTTTPPNCSGAEQIPMIETAADVGKTLGGNSDWVMGFNEPDLRGLSASDAAIFWRTYIEPSHPTKKLLSPAPSGGNETWLNDFRNSYHTFYQQYPRLDGLGMHCYAWLASQCYPHVQQVIEYANAWGVPEVWVSEFSFASNPNCGFGASPSQAMQMQQTFIDWMLGQPKVTRFAWFTSRLAPGNELPPCFYTPLIDWNTGQPTSYGDVYLPYQ